MISALRRRAAARQQPDGATPAPAGDSAAGDSAPAAAPVPSRPGPSAARDSATGSAAAGSAGDSVTGPGPVAPGRRLSALLRRHWLVAVLLLAGLVLRVLAQLAYRPALFYIDTTRYLYSAQGNDPVGYRLPLRVIAELVNLNAVAAVQHLLGLAMAAGIYVLLVRRGCARWLAALATAPVLLDAYQLQAEQTLMPDVLFEALIVAGIVVLAWRPRGTVWLVLAGGLILGAAAPVRQVGEILIVPALCYVLVAAGGWRRALGHAGLLCAAFAVPVLAYCTAAYVATGHFWLSHTGVTTTYGRMAAAADCTTLRLPVSQRALCPTPAQRKLGIDGLEHSPRSPLRPYYLNEKIRYLNRAVPSSEASRLVSAFNSAVLHQQPLRVLRAYGSDVVKLFAPGRTTSPGDTPVARWQFQTRYPYLPHAGPAFVATAAGRFGGGRPAVWRPVAGFLRGYQLHGGYTPGPLLALAALLGLAGSLTAARRRAGPGQRQLSRACLLFFVAGASVLLISDLFEFSWRYQLPALITLPPAAALALACWWGKAQSQPRRRNSA
jgi:hypothetical protein